MRKVDALKVGEQQEKQTQWIQDPDDDGYNNIWGNDLLFQADPLKRYRESQARQRELREERKHLQKEQKQLQKELQQLQRIQEESEQKREKLQRERKEAHAEVQQHKKRCREQLQVDMKETRLMLVWMLLRLMLRSVVMALQQKGKKSGELVQEINGKIGKALPQLLMPHMEIWRIARLVPDSVKNFVEAGMDMKDVA